MSEVDRSLRPEDVLREIEQRRLLSNARISADGDAIVGDLDLGQRVAPVRIVHPSALALPVISVEPPDTLGVLPHLDGIVCYQEKEGLVLNRREPGKVLAFAVQRARQVLRDGLAGVNAEDYVAEFASIWNRRPGLKQIISVLAPGDEFREVTLLSAPGTELYLMENESDLLRFHGGGALKRSRTLRRAVYAPIRGSSDIRPPAPRGDMWTPREIRERLLSGLDPDDLRTLEGWVAGRAGKSVDFFFFGLPTGRGGYSLFGVRFSGCGDPHPLQKGGTARSVTALRVWRLDRDFLMPRGGAMSELNDRSALVVGCGAVGGIIATEIARSGVGRLDLVDGDDLGEENTYRHVLGQASWGKNKAGALEEFISNNIPYIEVDGIPKNFEQAVRDEDIDLANYDVVFLATGDPTIELHLNEILATRGGPLAVFAWVEPLGIGGHALLTGTHEGGGCLECVFTSPDDPGEDLSGDRLAFAADGQEFGRELSGCGSFHTPFSSLDATRTATLAVTLGLRALTGQETHNAAESWRGDPEAFRAQGYETSNRYEASGAQLREQRRWEQSPRCPICHP